MAFQESIILFYIGISFLFGYISFKLNSESLEELVPKILFLGLMFLFLLNGLNTGQAILDYENYTPTPINETIYASISNKFDNSYTTLLWSFIFIFIWIVAMLIWKGKDPILNEIQSMKIKGRR